MTPPATCAICSRGFMRAPSRPAGDLLLAWVLPEHRRQEARRHSPARVATACCAVCGAPSYKWRCTPELTEPFEPRQRGRPKTNATEGDALAGERG